MNDYCGKQTISIAVNERVWTVLCTQSGTYFVWCLWPSCDV